MRVACGLLGSLLVAGSLHAQALDRFAFQHPQMGTTFRIVLYAPDSTVAHRAATAAFARIDTLNQHLSDYLAESELNRLSATAGTSTAVRVSEDLWEVLALATRIAEATNGAFDVTVGPMTRLWRWARRRGTLLPADRLRAAQAAVGYQHLHLNAALQTVRLDRAGMRLDLGGIAKGFAADEALQVLASFGLSRALVDAGGDLALGDPPPDATGWQVAVPVVSEGGDIVQAEHCLARQGVATSGATYRYIEVDGVRYSHILDPRTGVGVTHGNLVTVFAPTGAEADAWASALSVLLPNEGFQLLEQQASVAARIIARDADGPRQLDSSARDMLIGCREAG